MSVSKHAGNNAPGWLPKRLTSFPEPSRGHPAERSADIPNWEAGAVRFAVFANEAAGGKDRRSHRLLSSGDLMPGSHYAENESPAGMRDAGLSTAHSYAYKRTVTSNKPGTVGLTISFTRRVWGGALRVIVLSCTTWFYAGICCVIIQHVDRDRNVRRLAGIVQIIDERLCAVVRAGC
jgi:hypothetical protein